jgi:hypothetical protein
LKLELANKLEILDFSWNLFATQWEMKYGLLVRYRQANGHCLVPRYFVAKAKNKITDGKVLKEEEEAATIDQEVDVFLGRWVSMNRHFRKSGKLSEERISRLDAIGFSWNPHEERWRKWFDQLKRFHADRGHTAVSKTYRTEEGSRLRFWVNEQRRKYAKVTGYL